MKHRATTRFWQCYRHLPKEIQLQANRCYELLRNDLHHPSLHFKTVGRFRSVRIGLHYRALAVEEGNDVVWFWIGSHADYDKLIDHG